MQIVARSLIGTKILLPFLRHPVGYFRLSNASLDVGSKKVTLFPLRVNSPLFHSSSFPLRRAFASLPTLVFPLTDSPSKDLAALPQIFAHPSIGSSLEFLILFPFLLDEFFFQ